MSYTGQTTHLLGAGTLGYQFVPKLLAATDRLGVTERTFLTAGAAEFNRAVIEGSPVRLDRPGLRDVSPSHAEVSQAIGFTGSDFVAEASRAAWGPAILGMADRVVQQTLRARVTGSQTLWVQGSRTGHGKPAELLLQTLHDRVPDQFIVAKSTLPEDGDQRPLAATGLSLFRGLHERGVLATTVLTDNASPFAKAKMLAVQDAYEATALASWIGGLAQFVKNRAFGELGLRLGEQSPFAGWAFASQPVVVVHEGMGRRILGALGAASPRYDIGDVGHLVRIAQLTTEQALGQRAARALDEPVNARAPFYVVYTVPMATDSGTAWQSFSSQVRRYLTNTHPMAVPVFSSGSGTAEVAGLGRAWLQASVLYPLPAIPAPVADLLHPPAMARVLPLWRDRPDPLDAAAAAPALPAPRLSYVPVA